MYLISAYFDRHAQKVLNRYIREIAEETGNTFMTDHQVPAHLTISSVEARGGELLIPYVGLLRNRVKSGKIQIVSAGMLFPYVFYVTPLLNAYLQDLSKKIYDCVKDIPEVSISRFYRPMQWLPHITMGKKLTKEQMKIAFEVMQKQFAPLEATVTQIGLAKVNPHKDLWTLDL